MELSRRTIGGEVIITYSAGCPFKLIDPVIWTYLKFYRHYQNGYLLEGGGIGDQPAWYVDMIDILESELSSIEKEKLDERRKARG